ncbi:MAG: hypothetical protein N4A38_03470 [Candidatus Gracilibacteria bacterium]|nr:hypothetical protein [Candidatus Gracilibacteria bacterium]
MKKFTINLFLVLALLLPLKAMAQEVGLTMMTDEELNYPMATSYFMYEIGSNWGKFVINNEETSYGDFIDYLSYGDFIYKVDEYGYLRGHTDVVFTQLEEIPGGKKGNYFRIGTEDEDTGQCAALVKGLVPKLNCYTGNWVPGVRVPEKKYLKHWVPGMAIGKFDGYSNYQSNPNPHSALIIKVDQDHGTITVLEQNYDYGIHKANFRTLNFTSTSDYGNITKYNAIDIRK